MAEQTVTEQVLETCNALGFARAGVCAAEPSEYQQQFRQWLEAGKHGEMSYMAEHQPKRLDPRQLLPGARSIICVADRYHRGGADPPIDPGKGRVARYARGQDYHKAIKRRLHTLCDELVNRFPQAAFKACVDTAPLLEREMAQRAGLGAVGKHTLLIERGVGSYLLLGAIVTTLDLQPSEPAPPDPCSLCTRCIDACPTDAITPWSVDATRCISYLTIEHRSEIDGELAAQSGQWIFGCDICQEVCPHNRPNRRSQRATVHEAYTERRMDFDLLEILGWTEADRREAFQRSAMKRAKLPMMKRNALIAAGNSLRQQREQGGERAMDTQLLSRIRTLAHDEQSEPLIRRTAIQLLHSLESASDTAGSGIHSGNGSS